jgi:hypothetical protein
MRLAHLVQCFFKLLLAHVSWLTTPTHGHKAVTGLRLSALTLLQIHGSWHSWLKFTIITRLDLMQSMTSVKCSGKTARKGRIYHQLKGKKVDRPIDWSAKPPKAKALEIVTLIKA